MDFPIAGSPRPIDLVNGRCEYLENIYTFIRFTHNKPKVLKLVMNKHLYCTTMWLETHGFKCLTVRLEDIRTLCCPHDGGSRCYVAASTLLWRALWAMKRRWRTVLSAGLYWIFTGNLLISHAACHVICTLSRAIDQVVACQAVALPVQL